MRFLVTSTPRQAPTPDQVPALLEAERAWRERHAGRLHAYGWFAEGGGYGVADVDDLETIHRMACEHPLAPFSETTIRPVLGADVASATVLDVLAERVPVA
jgi:muconolactone delta-isomerase